MAVELTFWEPHGAQTHTRSVARPDEIEALAGDLLIRYQAAGDMLPGIELSTGEEGDSLSIAVSESGWALVHTDAEFDQHCTQGDQAAEGASVDVRWDSPTSVPRSWFIPKEAAIIGVSRWLADGTLAPELTWSDQCY